MGGKKEKKLFNFAAIARNLYLEMMLIDGKSIFLIDIRLSLQVSCEYETDL
jgi:hypothetical protein